MEECIPFPPVITTTKPLSLVGSGYTDLEMHFLQIKLTEIGVYMDPHVTEYLQKWKGRSGAELAGDDDFFEEIIKAPVQKLLRIVFIKEIRGSQYGVLLESAVRERLVEYDKYEEEEETALEEVKEFFPVQYLKNKCELTIEFPESCVAAEIRLGSEGEVEKKMRVENANVVEMMKRWYLGGSRGVSETTIRSLADTLATILSPSS